MQDVLLILASHEFVSVSFDANRYIGVSLEKKNLYKW